MVFKVTEEYTVYPEHWDDRTDEEMKWIYDSFKEWVIMNEENMTLSMADKAWRMIARMEKYMSKRSPELKEWIEC